MKVLITGTSQGIGKAIAEIFLCNGHVVIGVDKNDSSIENENYTHFQCDVRYFSSLPDINDVDVLSFAIYQL